MAIALRDCLVRSALDQLSGQPASESARHARSARAAGEQGAFWEFHDAVYAPGFPRNSGQLTDEVLLGVAADLGLDVERFTTAMQSSSSSTRSPLTSGRASNSACGHAAFLVNGRPIMGAQPTDTYVAAIEQAAEQAGSDG